MPAAAQLTRREYPALLADLAFSIELPSEFVEHDVPREDVDFSNPALCFPLLLASSPVAASLVTVSARPAYDDGCVEQWLRFLADHFEMNLTNVEPLTLGDQAAPLNAVLAAAEQVQDSTPVKFLLVALEDAKRLVIITAMAPAELWPSYGESFAAAVRSFRLARPQGQTAQVMLGFTPGPRLG